MPIVHFELWKNFKLVFLKCRALSSGSDDSHDCDSIKAVASKHSFLRYISYVTVVMCEKFSGCSSHSINLSKFFFSLLRDTISDSWPGAKLVSERVK